MVIENTPVGEITNVLDDDLGSVDLTNNEIVIKEAGIYSYSSMIKVMIRDLPTGAMWMS